MGGTNHLSIRLHVIQRVRDNVRYTCLGQPIYRTLLRSTQGPIPVVFSRNNTACTVTFEAECSETPAASSVIAICTGSRKWSGKDVVGEWLCVFTVCT